jgi:hypothetical protein
VPQESPFAARFTNAETETCGAESQFEVHGDAKSVTIFEVGEGAKVGAVFASPASVKFSSEQRAANGDD